MSKSMTPSVAEWFYMRGGERMGPVSQEALCGLFRVGTLNMATMVWNAAFPEWVAAGSIGGLRAASAEGGYGGEEAAEAGSGGAVLDYREEGTAVDGPAVDGPAGIGGWLIWPALGIVFGPVVLGMVGAGWWVAAPGLAARWPGRVGTMQFLAAMMGLLALFEVYAAVVFFRKKQSAPGAMIGVYLGSMMLAAGVVVLTGAWGTDGGGMHATWANVGPGMAVSLIWVQYFRVSRRVRNTFVN